MGFFDFFTSKTEIDLNEQRSSDGPSVGSLAINDDFWFTTIGAPASSGISVSRESAMRQWAVYACITEIAQTLAQLPLKLKRPAATGGTEDAIDHPLYDLCKNSPNPHMTSFNWRESQQANLLTTGNIYNVIERSTKGVKAIWPVTPSSVKPRFATGQEVSSFRLPSKERIVYEVLTTEGKKVYRARDILHVAGFGYDGLKGESVISNFAKEAIGNAIAIDQFQGQAMRNGIRPSGVLEHPDTLGDNKEAFLSALTRRYAGIENVARPMVLENGLTFKQLDVSFVDKQFVEQARLTTNAICGIFKVPPHRVGIFEKNTNYNNTEQGNKSFLDGTMLQWVTRWEQAMNWKLLTEGERKEGYFFKFNFDALLRPDAKTRSEMSWREWQQGTPLNEIRMRDDLPPIEGGDVAYVPVNMVPYQMAGLKPSQPTNDSQSLIEKDVDKLRGLFRRMAEKEIAKQVSGTSKNDFQQWVGQLRAKVEGTLARDVAFTVRSVLPPHEAEKVIGGVKEEFERRFRDLSALPGVNFANFEEVLA